MTSLPSWILRVSDGQCTTAQTREYRSVLIPHRTSVSTGELISKMPEPLTSMKRVERLLPEKLDVMVGLH